MQPPPPLILASASPRRVQLMHQAGYTFTALTPEGVEEAHDATLTPEALTVENARRKATAIAHTHPDALGVGADTLVYLAGIPLGKPATHTEAHEMLRRLSGRAHEVCTGVFLAWDAGRQGHGFHVISHVIFRQLSDEEIRAYHTLVDPLDKAGAYGIQEHGEKIITRHEGSWTNIMGLPMERLREELTQLTHSAYPPRKSGSTES